MGAFRNPRSASLVPQQNSNGRLEIDVVDRFGNRPVRLAFAEDGKITVASGAEAVDVAHYEPGHWYELGLTVDVAAGNYRLSIDGKPLPKEFRFAEYVKSVERLSLRTGKYRTEPTRSTPGDRQPDFTVPNPDDPEPVAAYAIDDVIVTPVTTIADGK